MGSPDELFERDVIALEGGVEVVAERVDGRDAAQHDIARSAVQGGNCVGPGGDHGGVDCERCREAISAGVDGEDAGVDQRFVEAHLHRCVVCRSYAAGVASLRHGTRMSIAEPVPDLSVRVRKMAAVADRASRWSVVRALLFVVAVQIIVFSLPALVFGSGQDSSTHAARHLGAFTVAYGVGLLVVVGRPARARTMLPVAVVLAGALTISAVIDLVNGHVPLVSEARHIPEVASVLLVWLLAAPVRRSSPLRRPLPGVAKSLEIVRDDRDTG